jgi:hypothetical protein
MAYFLSSSSSVESLSSEPREISKESPKKVSERATSKRSRKLPAKFREDYVPSTSIEEERLQKSMYSCLPYYI